MPTADEHLASAGPGKLAELVRSRELRPRQVVELFLGRIEALDPRLNAFRTTMPEEALAAADALPADGLLAGVPVAIKDDTPAARPPTTCHDVVECDPAYGSAALVFTQIWLRGV